MMARWLPLGMFLLYCVLGNAVIADRAAEDPTVGPTAWEQFDVSMGVKEKTRRYTVSVRLPVDYVPRLPEERLPEERLPEERLPVVLFLHGAGERGDSVELVRSVGLPTIAPKRREILVVPQTPEGKWWSDPEVMSMVMQALERVLIEWGGDRNRVYLTGLSMGGHGALQLAARYPDQFAAVLAICPRLGRPSYLPPLPQLPSEPQILADPKALAARLLHTPLWLFHGDDDEVVPVSNSRQLARALDALGADSRYTEIKRGDHGIWPRVYSRQYVLDWLYSNSLRQEVDYLKN